MTIAEEIGMIETEKKTIDAVNLLTILVELEDRNRKYRYFLSNIERLKKSNELNDIEEMQFGTVGEAINEYTRITDQLRMYIQGMEDTLKVLKLI